jgi:pimeloyl-ACP methyl ester carboxylesterase
MGRALLAVLAALAASCILASSAGAEVRWLCRPDVADDPCDGDQTTRYFESDGSSRVEQVDVPTDPPIDCFYVYPTVSNQPTRNATQTPDPEVRSIAKYQAQRFSTKCRVFVPLYRQVTAAGITLAGQTGDTSAYETAYTDVREAWLRYLREDNGGRGVVLIGHSQGSRMLRRLIRDEIDRNPRVRRLLVSAIIPGANANVLDFQKVPACSRPGQTGCVVSYATFNETPPDNTRYGRTDTDPARGALGLPWGPGVEALCTDPTALSGTGGNLESLVPSEPFAPGIIALLLLRLYNGPPPSADTPWLQPQDHYTGRCETSNNANVLMISPVADAEHLTPSPDSTWGVHLVDINLPLGNLVKIVGLQTQAYLAADH